MRKQLSGTIFLSLLATNILAVEQVILVDEADRINYSIGHQIGTDFKRQKLKLDEKPLRKGLQHGQTDIAPLLDRKEMTIALADLKRNISNKMRRDAIAKINKKKMDEQQKRSAGIAFMQENQRREGVKTMPSGLQYKVLTKGAGVKAKIEDYVTFNYRAKTLDGREYDNSFKKGKPATYRANGVLSGFTEAIQMMQSGSKWELYIPPDQAYGRKGPLAHQTIIIEVELLAINSRKKTKDIVPLN